MKKSLLCLIFLSFLFCSIPADARKLNPGVEKAVQARIEKEKSSGYTDFQLLYVNEANGRIRLVYSSVNLDMASFVGTEKWLVGFTFSNNGGVWYYAGGKSTDYLDENKLEKMKEWADDLR